MSSPNDFIDIEIPGLENKFPFPFNTMIEGLSNNDYHGAGGLSSTRFPLMEKSIRVFLHRHLFDSWKPCFDKGNLIHDCILLPDLVENTYIEAPTVGMDTVAANKLRKANPEKIVVGKGEIEEYETVAKLARVIFPFLAFDSTKTEVSFFHHHKETDLTFQIRPDIYNPQIGMLYDVKSTKANTHAEFEKLIEQYNYDLSIAFYFDVLAMCGYKTNLNYTGWLCIPITTPHIPFAYRVSQELIEKGRSKYQRYLTKYMNYMTSLKEQGETNELIYADVAEKEAHSWEYRKENY
jgi:hypothetical protein